MGERWKKKIMHQGVAAALALGCAGGASAIGGKYNLLGDDLEWTLSGYVRNHISVNLEDHDGFRNNGKEIGGAGQMSMNRNTAKYETNLKWKNIRLTWIGRNVREILTPYEKNLQENGYWGSFPLRIGGRPGSPTYTGKKFLLNWLPIGQEKDFLDHYDEDQFARELYVDFDIGPRLHFRLGRQQVVWGEADVFSAVDVIHGMDLKWRALFDDGEELRKPNTMANVTLKIPELEGNLQLLWKPGIDGSHYHGSYPSLFGGRWTLTPLQGVNAMNLMPLNFHSKFGDVNDDEYGMRWTGTFKQVMYGISWWHGMSQAPVMNCRPSVYFPLTRREINVNPECEPYKGRNVPKEGRWAEGILGEIIFPVINTFGFTLNSYITPLDGVLRFEAAYTPDNPFAKGTHTWLLWDNLAQLSPGLRLFQKKPLADVPLIGLDLPGSLGIKELDVLRYAFGFDKFMNSWQKVFKSDAPPMVSVQMFDQWVMGDRHDVPESLAFASSMADHNTILSGALLLNYMYSTLNPTFAVGVDTNGGDAFSLIGLDYMPGSHWRIHSDIIALLPQHKKKDLSQPCDNCHLLGAFADDSQWSLRVSYYF